MNSMKDILNAFDNGSTKSVDTSSKSTMKSLLESLDRIEEGASLNVSIAGDTPDDVTRIMQTISGSDQSVTEPTITSEPLPSDLTTAYDSDFDNQAIDTHELGTIGGKKEITAQEEYNNEPEEEYQDVSDIVDRPSDDLNKKKKSYPRAEPGDNPMDAKYESLKNELSRALREHMNKLK